LALLLPRQVAAQDSSRKVLVLYSFGNDYFDDIADGLRGELARVSPVPVEIFEVSLETARFGDTSTEEPFLAYLHALFDETRLDLVIAVAGPAARFAAHHRDSLFPGLPLVLAGVEARVMEGLATSGAVTVPIALDFAVAVENILRVAPGTSEVVVVLGRSAISRIWLVEIRKALQPLSGRVRLTWLHDLPLEEVRERVAALPGHAAVLFCEYGSDAGLVNDRDRALESLGRVSGAPVFGLFESQLGTAIVGGPLLSEKEVGRRAGAVAGRILAGESPGDIEQSPVSADRLLYDFRQLERWGISESRLPPGSAVLFRPASLWDEYRWFLLIGLGVLGLQAILIGRLLVQHSRRRAAEEEARALAQRLLTAHEDERRRLARELHDDLSQRLATLGLDVARMERSLPDTPQKESVRTMRADLVRLSEDVHDLSYQLHPSVLDELGLKNAIEVECDRFSRRESIPAELTSFDAPSGLPKEVSVCLFRIAQEALRNVARHAKASRVSVSVASRNGGVSMMVKDDGAGFDTGGWRKRHSLGHASMRERARLVRGTVDFESAPGRGTTVRVSVPLEEGFA
jgi:signal transduction histidine kinase